MSTLPSSPPQDSGQNIGIIAGGGDVPLLAAQSLQQAGRHPHVIYIEGCTTKEELKAFPHMVGEMLKLKPVWRFLREHRVKDLVFCGYVPRPKLRSLRWDTETLKELPGILRNLSGSDNTLLTYIAQRFSSKGFHVRSLQEMVPSAYFREEGVLTKVKPDAKDEESFRHAKSLMESIAAFDVGQSVASTNKIILAIEAQEGTDAMLERIAVFREGWDAGDRSGVFLKMPKKHQDLRMDIPVVGIKTVEGIVRARLKGLYLQKGLVFCANKQDFLKALDAHRLFLKVF